jgi:hypothetical protein
MDKPKYTERDFNRCRADFAPIPSRCPRCGKVLKTPFGMRMHIAYAAKFQLPGHEDVSAPADSGSTTDETPSPG